MTAAILALLKNRVAGAIGPLAGAADKWRDRLWKRWVRIRWRYRVWKRWGRIKARSKRRR
jgi:hypothetical protein